VPASEMGPVFLFPKIFSIFCPDPAAIQVSITNEENKMKKLNMQRVKQAGIALVVIYVAFRMWHSY
jgi:hypothetical protein